MLGTQTHTLSNFITGLRQTGVVPNIIPDELAVEIVRSNSIDAKFASYNALDYAAKHKHGPLIQTLVEQHNATGIYNCYVLKALIEGAHNDILNYLLFKSAIQADISYLLALAAECGNSEIFGLLLQCGAKLEKVRDYTGKDPIEAILKSNKFDCLVPFLAYATDTQVQMKNASGQTFLHVWALMTIDRPALVNILTLRVVLKDKRVQAMIEEKDCFGCTMLDYAKMRKLDDVIRALFRDPNLAVTQLPGYGKSPPDISQSNLNPRLLTFLAMNRQVDVGAPEPYTADQIVDKRGTCGGWGWWCGISSQQGPDALAEYNAMRELLAQWNQHAEPSPQGPGLSTLLKDLPLPASLKKKFPPIVKRDQDGNLYQRDANVKDLFGFMCSKLAIYHSFSPAVMDRLIINNQSEREKQSEMVGDLEKHDLQFNFSYPSMKISTQELAKLFAYFQQFPSRIFDCIISGPNLTAHQILLYTDDKGGLHYFDSNLKRSVLPFSDPIVLAHFCIKRSVIPISFLDNNKIIFSFCAYQLLPKQNAKSLQIHTAPAQQNCMGFNAIHWAIMTKNDEQLNIALNSSDVKKMLETSDQFGLTPMSLALKLGNVQYILKLLAVENNGVMPFRHSNLVDFSLLFSIEFHDSIIRLLFEREESISPDFTDKYGVKLINEMHRCSPPFPLMGSICGEQKYSYAFIYYLEHAGYQADFQELGTNPSAEKFLVSLAVAGLLDPNFGDKHGTTPFILAVKHNMIDHIEYLVRERYPNSYVFEVDVDQADKTGMTPLMWAVATDNLYAAQVLMNAKANPKLKNAQGYTAIQLAKSRELEFISIIDPSPRQRQIEKRKANPPITPAKNLRSRSYVGSRTELGCMEEPNNLVERPRKR